MLDLIIKYQAGGLIDTDSMRKDLRKDSSFYKKGDYTSKGKKRLAAIQQIEDNQGKGLRYKTDPDSQTFVITDQRGRHVSETTTGRGIGVEEKSGPLYGLVSRSKSSKKEVSQALAGIDGKYLVKKDTKLAPKKTAEKPKTTTTTSPVTPRPTTAKKVEGKTEPKIVTETKKKVEVKVKPETETVKETAKTEETKVDVPENAKARIDSNVSKLASNFSSDFNAENINSKAVQLKNTISGIEEELEGRSKGSTPNPKYKNSTTEKLLQSRNNLKKSFRRYLNDQSIGHSGTVIGYLQHELEQLDATPYSDEQEKKVLIDYIRNKKKTWESLPGTLSKNSSFSVIEEMLKNEGLQDIEDTGAYTFDRDTKQVRRVETYGEKIKKIRSNKKKSPIFQKGGKLIPKFQFGSKFITQEELERLRDTGIEFETPEELAARLEDPTITDGIDEDDATSAHKRMKLKERKPLFAKRAEYRDAGVTSDPYGRGKGPLFSRTGINTPLGDIQYNDIAQFLLARKARKQKVADVPVALEKYARRGSRNVLAARDIDSAMLNQAEKNIAAIRSGYEGSDPIMNMIANKMTSSTKAQERGKLIAKRAEYRRQEEDRVAGQMEEKRQQVSQDRVGATDVENRNRERLYQAELAKAQSEQATESGYLKNVSSIIANIQSRWNADARQRANARMTLDSQSRAQNINNLYNQRQTLLNQITDKRGQASKNLEAYTNSLVQQGFRGDDLRNKISEYEKSYMDELSALNQDYELLNEELAGATSTDSEKLMSRADAINKGDRVFRLVKNR